uniref:Ionotropic receptor IR26 n=1 Tax=Lobesia botrana TaxID=209534 RepID=A0A345BF33_9NEOP|nr:ionotropic receptor IR26 [Lobesia botrana]
MMSFQLFILILFLFTKTQCYESLNGDYVEFLKDFLQHEGRPATIVSHLQMNKNEHVKLCRALSLDSKQFQISSKTNNLTSYNNDIIHLADVNSDFTRELLNKAIKDESIKTPARWLLLVKNNRENELDSVTTQDYRRDIEDRFSELYIQMDTEVYITYQQNNYVHVHAVYKIKANLPLQWEEYGVWTASPTRSSRPGLGRAGFDRPHPGPVAMRRRDMRGVNVVAATVILDNGTLRDMPHYLRREIDTLSKIMYYMTIHLIEWVNGTRVLNRTSSWGYRLPNGRYDGVVREIQDGRADISGSVMIPTKERSQYLNFVIPPAPIEAMFIFKKPALASVTNIYVLPFSIGVWLSLFVLIFASSLTLFLAYYQEDDINPQHKKTCLQKMSEGAFETLCLVFQQGTAIDPSSIAGRQILILGLMAFMFLYTAYSANVVALLQSPTNDINSVETLLTSPISCGSQDVQYARKMFSHETRPIHRALSQRKILPHGEKAFLSIEEGIRKVREDMFAFHVEMTAGYDQIQRTFLEDEKCNLGAIKYMSLTYPYLALSETSPIKEQLRIGAHRIMEGGIQKRTVRRMVPEPPRCGASTAMFTAVRLSDVEPAFQALLAVAALCLPILALEVVVRRRELKKQNSVGDIADSTPNDISAPQSVPI